MDELQDLHARLHASFQALRESRAGTPVFVLEYDAAETPREALEGSVRAGLSTHLLNEIGWWATRHLPLLVILAEQGYDYDGPGTDFWPRFEERVGCHLSSESRQAVVHFFERGSSTLGFARPAKSPWSDKFHLMAWPVTHAVLPRHLHLPFARSLTQIKEAVNPEMPAGRVAALMFDTLKRTDHSSRYETFLNEQHLVAALVCMSLGISGHDWLAPTLVSRLSADMQNVDDVDRAILAAKQIQHRHRIRQPSPCPSVALPVADPILTLNESAKRDQYLAIRFPVVPPEILIAVNQDATARLFCTSLWRTTRPIRLTSLLSTLSTPLQMSTLPQVSAELFASDDLSGLPAVVRDYLAACACTFNRPLLFLEDKHELTLVVDDRSISNNSRVVVVDEDGTWADLGERVGYLLAHPCYALDLTSTSTVARLKDCGVSLATSVTLTSIGTPRLHSVGVSQFLPDDVIGFQVDCPMGATLAVDDGADAIPATASDIVTVSATIGQHALRVRDNQGHTLAAQPVAVVDGYTYSPIVTITLTENITRGAIGKRRAAIIIKAGLELSDSSVNVMLYTKGGVAAACEIMAPRVPCELSFADPRFDAFFTESVVARLKNADDVYIEVCVDGLGHRRFLLPQDEQVQHWWRNRICETDGGPVPHGVSHAARPTVTMAADGTLQHLCDACLLVPLDDEDRVGEGLCIAPETLSLYLPEIEKPKLLRQLDDTASGTGLISLFSAYLNWALADAEHGVAEIRRRGVADVLDSWTAEVVCGSSWVVAERQAMHAATATVWQRLAGQLIDGPIDGLARCLEACMPWLDALASRTAVHGRSSELRYSSDIISDALGDALTEYDPLRGGDIAPGLERLATLDCAVLLAEWDRQHHLHDLLSRVWPTQRQLELAAIAVSRVSRTEIAGDITSWRRTFSDLPSHEEWDAQDVKTVLDMWANPAQVHGRPGKRVLSKLRNDVGMARALRYVALELRKP